MNHFLSSNFFIQEDIVIIILTTTFLVTVFIYINMFYIGRPVLLLKKIFNFYIKKDFGLTTFDSL